MAPSEPTPGSLTRSQVLRDLALDLHGALARQGRAPFVLSGLPLFDDLQALRQTLTTCLALGEDPTLRHWQTVLERVLPSYEPAFADIRQALAWVEQIKTLLDRPLPTDTAPGLGGDAVALELAHALGLWLTSQTLARGWPSSAMTCWPSANDIGRVSFTATPSWGYPAPTTTTRASMVNSNANCAVSWVSATWANPC